MRPGVTTDGLQDMKLAVDQGHHFLREQDQAVANRRGQHVEKDSLMILLSPSASRRSPSGRSGSPGPNRDGNILSDTPLYDFYGPRASVPDGPNPAISRHLGTLPEDRPLLPAAIERFPSTKQTRSHAVRPDQPRCV